MGVDDIPQQDPPPTSVEGSHSQSPAVPDQPPIGLSSDPPPDLQEQGVAEALIVLQTTSFQTSTTSRQKLHPRLKTMAHKKCSSYSRLRKVSSSSAAIPSLEPVGFYFRFCSGIFFFFL